MSRIENRKFLIIIEVSPKFNLKKQKIEENKYGVICVDVVTLSLQD